jgi:hypothetical protein
VKVCQIFNIKTHFSGTHGTQYNFTGQTTHSKEPHYLPQKEEKMKLKFTPSNLLEGPCLTFHLFFFYLISRKNIIKKRKPHKRTHQIYKKSD